MEQNLPEKHEIIDTFRKLSDKLGPHRVIWRYDPIILTGRYNSAYHGDNFCKMVYMLKGYTEKVTISFIDFYSKIERAMSEQKIEPINSEAKHTIAKEFSTIAHENSLTIDTCAEDIDLSQYGMTHARCIDGDLVAQITGHPVYAKKDKSQRPECGCAASVDIGAYNTCSHGCLYCYANYSYSTVVRNMDNHNKLSPLLIGESEVSTNMG
jgi:hypothetical protein